MTPRTCPTCGAALPGDAPEALCPRCLLRVALESSPSPRGHFVAPSTRDLAPHFPQLEILGLIGHGGMGAVYKARQTKLDRLVALKILPHEAGDDPAFAERFVREARALARLQHPHIVTVHDFGEAGGFYYLVMEFVDGSNLRQVMKDGRVAPDRALAVLIDLCEALSYAHQNDVVHRDLKPENVLIDRRGQVKLADFGLAKLVNPDPAALTLTEIHQAVGTPHYMAPEQLERPAEVDRRADIYSLGVVAYEMLTGELPLGRFDPPSKRSGVHRTLDDVVMKALERDPARRYQSADEMLAVLRRLSSEPMAPVAPVSMPEPEPLDASSEALIMMGLMAGIIGVVIGVIGAKNAWFGAALFAVEYVAESVPWRADRRPVIGTLLALGGVAVALAILIFDPGKWWLIFVLVFVYGHWVSRFFKGVAVGWHALSGVADQVPDWDNLTPLEQRVAAAVYDADEEGVVIWPVDLDGDDLAKLRESNELPAEERLLCHVPLSDDGEGPALVFGSRHVYFPAKQGNEPVRCSLAYDSLPGRSFVNHGNAVYAGDGVTLTPEDEVNCAALAAILNAVARILKPATETAG
jgi:tRNA A-37 threonylcarbamoyl transferase component Bud32